MKKEIGKDITNKSSGKKEKTINGKVENENQSSITKIKALNSMGIKETAAKKDLAYNRTKKDHLKEKN